MNKLLEKRHLNPTVTLFTFEAPLIAKKAEPGQFVIIRPNENSERIPLTIADFDREKGTVTVIVQIVGGTTADLNAIPEGEYIRDVA
ncbi:MAG: sulfide/dihydroorotate dehydrogenase-like FAD/NAD-binding protein, partial [Clostridia bacterium]|nr:sulfide/dihydroorotate dehydrogenase-like FAD/NAD-binding protein [Clostridia bacterium]